jgi:hypothetical protein
VSDALGKRKKGSQQREKFDQISLAFLVSM